MKALGDQVTFLGHDLNASAVASLKPDAAKLNKQSDELVKRIDQTMAAAQQHHRRPAALADRRNDRVSRDACDQRVRGGSDAAGERRPDPVRCTRRSAGATCPPCSPRWTPQSSGTRRRTSPTRTRTPTWGRTPSLRGSLREARRRVGRLQRRPSRSCSTPATPWWPLGRYGGTYKKTGTADPRPVRPRLAAARRQDREASSSTPTRCR